MSGNKNGSERLKGFMVSIVALSVFFCLASSAQQTEVVPGKILVKPRAHLSEIEFSRRIAAHGARRHRTLDHTHVRVLSLPEENIESALAAFQNDPDFEFAERDIIARACATPNDPYVVSGLEWHLGRIQALQAWDITSGISNVIVAVLDSGVNAAHPDLAGHILPGYDFVNNHPDAPDDFGHGTAVAGTLVASGNNGQGVAGVSYGCTVLSVKVMDTSGSASHSTIAQGIEYAVQQGARIINLSLGGDWPSHTLQDGINYAWSNNVIVVAAAGNTAANLPQYPAACDHVLAVASTEEDDSLSSFSTYGPFVSLCAPGDNIWTTQSDLNNPYGAWRGTSFASPVVAGVAALVLSLNPSLLNTQVVDVLKQTADDLGAPGYDSTFASGRVNAYRAVLAVSPAVAIANPAPTLPPVAVGDTGPGSLPAPILPTNSSPQTVSIGTAPLHVQINGSGTTVPNLSGAQLAIGRTYRIRAVPAPGQLFTGWSGDASAQLPLLSFTMQSNLTLVANFVLNPFPAVRGTYSGLAANTNGVTPDSSAYFSLTLTRSGSFSGHLLSAGRRFGFTGRFDPSGSAKVHVRQGLAPGLALALTLDLSNSTGQLAGSLTDGNWTSGVSADKNVFNALSNPAQQTGIRPFSLERFSDKTAAATGLSSISMGGATRFRGRLSDGRPFGTSSALARNGDCPFYLSLNRGTEVVIGWLNFPSVQGPDASGTVLWVKTGTNAFAATLQITNL